MEDYPYDESLEWVPREYPIDDDANPASKPLGGQQHDRLGYGGYSYTGYIDYPNPQQSLSQRQRHTQHQQYRQYQQQAGSARAGQAQQRQQFGQASHYDASRGRMSKGEALNLLESLKKSILVGAIIAFGVLSALVATHAVGSAAGNNTSSPSPSVDPSQQQNPSDPGGGFFNQQGGGGGYQFGPGGSQPFSGSHTS